MNLREVSVIYDHLVVFIRHDPAEIRGLAASSQLGPIGPKIEATTGVFVLIVCDLKRSNSSGARKPSMIFTYRKHKQSHISQKRGLSR
jgi:hypothetical protein